jgi:hypothetical protein
MTPRVRIPLCVTLAAMLLLSACVTGRVRTSAEVARSFQDLTVPAAYTYWYLNQENAPYAVIGLEGEWRVEDKQWHPVKPGTPTFQKVVYLVGNFPDGGHRTSGATLLDPNGTLIGIWYSSLNPGVYIDPERKVVNITTREPWRQPG